MTIIHFRQKGFTLLELLIAMAITAVISLALANVIIQVYMGNAYGVNRLVATKEVENSVIHISRDAQMAQTILHPDNVARPFLSDPNSHDTLYIRWTEWSAPMPMYEITYYLDGNVLKKQEIDTTTGQPTVVSQVIVARHIDSSSRWSWDGTMLVVTVTSRVGGYRSAQETGTARVWPRSTQS